MNQQIKFNAPFLYGSTGLQRGLSIFELTIGYMSRIRPKKSMDQVWSSAFFFQVSLIGSLATVLWIVATSTMLRWMKMLICAEWSECDYFLFISTTISINCIWAFFFFCSLSRAPSTVLVALAKCVRICNLCTALFSFPFFFSYCCCKMTTGKICDVITPNASGYLGGHLSPYEKLYTKE